MVGPLSDGIVVKTKGETVDKSCDKSIDPVDALKVTGKDWVEGGSSEYYQLPLFPCRR